MKNRIMGFAMALAAIAVCMTSLSSEAATWRGATDSQGVTWARIKFVNQSGHASNWSISNCRTTTSAGQGAAATDAAKDWNGVVAPGSTAYVWVYAVDGDVLMDNADGGSSAYNAAASPMDGADAEWVVTIGADGTVESSLELADAYQVPVRTGTMPNLE